MARQTGTNPDQPGTDDHTAAAAGAELRLRDTDLEWVDAGNEIVAIDLDSGNYLALNITARPLWELLAAGTTRAALIASLVERYDIDAATAAADVDALVARLGELDLLATP